MLKKHTGNVLDKKNNYSVIDCKLCGFKHILPLPSQEQTNKLYRDIHYDDGELDRIQYYERDREWWLMNYSDILSEISNYIVLKKNHYLLDIGCGAGIFLEAAKRKKLPAIGIEISKIAAKHCQQKGLNVINGSFNDNFNDISDKINIIHMRNILEHIPDPKNMLKIAYNTMEKDSLLIVGVPNDYNPIQQGLRSVKNYEPWWVSIPHHLNYFNYNSLEKLISNCGFNVVGRFTSFTIELFLTMGDNYIKNPSVGRKSHKKRMNFENFMDKANLSSLRRNIYRAFAKLNLGREAIVFAIKK